MSDRTVFRTSEEAMLTMTVSALTERSPKTMPLPAVQGIDLCCGGGHTLLKALTLHGVELDSAMPELKSVVDSSERRGW